MKIDITKKEYLTLLELLQIANWALHAHHVKERSKTKKYRKFEQKIFSHAKEMGLGDLVHYDSKLKRYFPTRTFEETSPAKDLISEFENDTFWDELIHRLVERDLIRQEGERVLLMSLEQRAEKEEPLEKRYNDEFYNHGLENLALRS